ncbi:MAG: pyrimidine reductase family protein [Actinomycetota bacterium]|nr:pyrimidine reductase family protein [Actinomycetota bacterium]
MRALLSPDASPFAELADLEAWYHVPSPHHVRANFVASLDGAIELDGRSGGLGGPGDYRVFHVLRALTDVVLVGAGTVRSENYGPVRLDEAVQERRISRGQAPVPPVAVITGTAGLDTDIRLFDVPTGAPHPIILTTSGSAPDDVRDALSTVADVVICGEGAVDLTVAMKALADRGLGRVLCEGGATILGQLAREALLDELCLTLSPVLAGPGHTALTFGHRFPAPLTLELTHLLEDGGLLLARYAAKQGAGL